MTEILHVHYDFITDQCNIASISRILKWLGGRGFTIINYSRPPSNNALYPNIEFIAQRDTAFTSEEATAWQTINRMPLLPSSYQMNIQTESNMRGRFFWACFMVTFVISSYLVFMNFR